MKERLLQIKNLTVEYNTFNGIAKALNDVNFEIYKNEATGLVGETGAGKTSLALAILKILPAENSNVISGSIIFNGEDISKYSEKQMQKIRGEKISMIFQNPLTSLNPVFTVGEQIAMVFRDHMKLSKKESYQKAEEMLETVGIPKHRLYDYPNQFSGGMRQRVGIAAALACTPDLLIADEPTTALDVTIQAQVLELMKELKKKYSTSILLITHNFGIVADICEKVAVMYAGSIVEYGKTKDVFATPIHPYTKGLFNAIPDIKNDNHRLTPIKGTVPNALSLPNGCRFHPRCNEATEKCLNSYPQTVKVGEDHYISCFNLLDQHGRVKNV